MRTKEYRIKLYRTGKGVYFRIFNRNYYLGEQRYDKERGIMIIDENELGYKEMYDVEILGENRIVFKIRYVAKEREYVI